jgi:multiple sugar transport system permease protein
VSNLTITESATSTKAAGRGAWSRRVRGLGDGRLLAYGLLSPGVIALALLILVPVGYAAVWSLKSWSLTEINLPKQYVGLHNYRDLLHDGTFWKSLRNTGVFMVASVGIELAIGFAVALALFHVTRGRKLVNALILLPMILSPVLVALIWRYIYDNEFGPLNIVIRGLGLGAVNWLGSERLALPSVIAVDVWQFTPFAVLVLHAGLLTVPPEIIEAAKVDGASPWRLTRHILLPWVMPFVLVIVLIRSIDAYRIFDTIYLLTQGGPASATDSLSTYAQRVGFGFFKMGYSMAIAVVMLAIIAVVCSFYLRLLRGRR